MPDQSARQRARRVVRDARRRRAEQDKRRAALAELVVAALTERDAAVAACDARAGQALLRLCEQEGLTLGEAIDWCGGAGQLSLREASRLRQLATSSLPRRPPGTGSGPAAPSSAGPSSPARPATAVTGDGVATAAGDRRGQRQDHGGEGGL